MLRSYYGEAILLRIRQFMAFSSPGKRKFFLIFWPVFCCFWTIFTKLYFLIQLISRRFSCHVIGVYDKSESCDRIIA